MPSKTWLLCDAASGTYIDELSVSPADANWPAADFSVKKRRLAAGLSQGVDIVEVANGPWRYVLLPTRGMGVWKAWHGKTEIGWQSPVRGPVHPQFVAISEPGGLGWLDGFDELVCRCGLESNGVPEFDEQGRLTYPLHGRIANRPAHRVELQVDPDRGEIRVIGEVDETRFHFSKLRLKSTATTRIGEAALHIVDEVTNLSGSPAEMQLLYHVNLGPPTLEAGSKVVAPATTVAPRDAAAGKAAANWDTYAAAQPGTPEAVYFCELSAGADDRTGVMLKDAHGTRGVGLRFSRKQLPYFIVWKNTTDERDGYVTGLEPATNLPNARSFEKSQGRVVELEPGQTARFELTLEYYADGPAVANAEERISALAGGAQPQVLTAPRKSWSP